MQRVSNCILLENDQILLLQKPKRGWWVAPGGKMEHGESVKDTVIREFREETGVILKNPALKGIFTMIIKEQGKDDLEWMMFTFLATEYEGENVSESDEGKLAWHSIFDVSRLSMAPGDPHIIDFVIKDTGIIYGTFTYTPDFELISFRLDSN